MSLFLCFQIIFSQMHIWTLVCVHQYANVSKQEAVTIIDKLTLQLEYWAQHKCIIDSLLQNISHTIAAHVMETSKVAIFLIIYDFSTVFTSWSICFTAYIRSLCSSTTFRGTISIHYFAMAGNESTSPFKWHLASVNVIQQ